MYSGRFYVMKQKDRSVTVLAFPDVLWQVYVMKQKALGKIVVIKLLIYGKSVTTDKKLYQL